MKSHTVRFVASAVFLAAFVASAVPSERNPDYEQIIADANAETAAYRALIEKGGETVSSDPIAAGRAIEKPNLVYPVLYRPGKTLTGRLADWDDVPFEGVVRAKMGGSSAKAPADLLPKFKACVSDTSLFILLTAKDAHLAFARNRECLYRNDCFEVYLDPLFTHAFAMGELVSQTFVTPADTNATEIIASGKLPWKTKSVAFAGGWAAELELPLDNPYFSVKPFDGLRLGVNVSYCNNDHPTKSTVTCKTGWSKLDIGDNSYQTPGVYGVWTVVMDRPAPVRAAAEGPIIAANDVRRREGGTLEDPELLGRHRPSPLVTRGFNADASERNCADCRTWGGDNLRVTMLPFPVRYFKKFKTTEGYTECAVTNLIQMCRTARRHGIKLIVGCGGLPHLKGCIWLDNADETIAYWTNVIARVQAEKDAIWGFDLVNEPLDFKQLPMAPIEFRPFFCKAIEAIRKVDKTSWLIYESGPGGEWDGFEKLLPLPDPRIIYSCHFYKPGAFTHQGVDGALLQDPHLTPKAQTGTSLLYPGYFFGRWFDRAEMERQLEPVIAFQRKWNVPIYIGEFSCTSWGPKGSTAQYLDDCTSIFEKYGWSWSYHNLNGWQGWNLDSADGVYTNLNKIPKDPNTLRAQVMRRHFARAKLKVKDETDPSLSVFLSDIHVAKAGLKTKWGAQPDYQNPLFEKAIDEVLAMRPRPARVIVLGDLALWFGWQQDYEQSLPGFNRLKAAGIDVFVTTGNHDHREPLFKVHPRQAEITPVPGRFVSVIDLGFADLYLLDTLQENEEGEGSGNAVSGALDAAQADWLVKTAAQAKRPYFLGAHHPPKEIKIGGKDIRSVFETDPHFAGYLHGHDHRWYKQWHHNGYTSPHVVRSVCLPSTGWWGDIGFAVMRTFADRAELQLIENDFFFPKPLGAGEKRPREWDEILSENRAAARMIFPF